MKLLTLATICLILTDFGGFAQLQKSDEHQNSSKEVELGLLKKDSGHHHHHHHNDDKKDGEEHHHHEDKKDGKEHHHHGDKKDGKGREHHHSKDKDGKKHHHHHCDNKPPGIDLMAKGIDITTLDLFPTDLKAPNGRKDTIFEFTCDSHQHWKHPTLTKKYQKPDQVQSITSEPEGAMKTSTDVHSKLSDYKNSMAVKVGLKVRVGHFGAFGASVGYKETKENILKTSRSVAETSAYKSAIGVEFKGNDEMRLSHKFSHFLKKLPANFSDDPEQYYSLFDKFGTHFFSSAKFGGLIHMRSILENSYMKSTSEKQIKAQMEISFFRRVKIGGSVEAASKTVDEEFSSHTEQQFYYFGGRPNLAKDDALEKWFDTVDRDPWLFFGQLEPIEGVIHDHHIRRQVKLAANVRGCKTTVADLEDALQMSGITLDEKDTKELKKVKHYLKHPKKITSNKKLEHNCKKLDKIFKNFQEKVNQPTIVRVL